MMQKLVHYAKKVIQLGPRKSVQVIDNKIRHTLFSVLWRYKAERCTAAHTWLAIAKKHALRDFALFFSQVQQRATFFIPSREDDQASIFVRANNFVHNKFDLLGSGLQQFEVIPWHVDFRLLAQNPGADCTFPANIFYQDIKIEVGGSQLTKDIKVPWELSRFQHLLSLGEVYKKTQNPVYAQKFTEHITSWLDHNPFFLGTNWVCPMEVGIRGINWVLAFEYFKNCPEISQEFWQRFVCNLYDHLFYLENNWEVYDTRTSNHYLSDLVGYLYLCYFLNPLPGFEKKVHWCWAELMRECDKQIFAEGTSYEGSTTYHRLVTELFYLAYLLAQKLSVELSDNFIKKLQHMIAFVDWCTPIGGNLITIGDHDSGHITCFEFGNNSQQNSGTAYFPQFGLSVVKTDPLHLTLRHHAYEQCQPSGHFHNDLGSITLAIRGIPVLVDPGSFVYTPSSVWRNKFRSVAVHNTFFLDGQEPVSFDDRLFALSLPAQRLENAAFVTQHTLYKGLTFNRSLEIDHTKNTIIIADFWTGIPDACPPTVWNFTLGPEIEAVQEGQSWLLKHKGAVLVCMTSPDLTFEQQPTWVSLEYGSKMPSACLRATQSTVLEKTATIYITYESE